MVSSRSSSSDARAKGDGTASLNDVVDRFEEAWERGDRPEIVAYLHGAPSPAERRRWLAELIHIEFERRLRGGDSTTVEEYLVRFPELAGDAAFVSDLVSAEHLLRHQCGSVEPWEAYVARFPQFQAQLRALRRVGRFELLEQLGSGSFGAVWKALDSELHRFVAVKVLHPTRLASAIDRERFWREGRSAAILQHPGIVPVHEVGLDGDLPYLVSEYVEGVTLAAELTRRQFGARESAEIAMAVSTALGYAHARGIVHRDVKPANILLPAASDGSHPAPESQARLMDFGLAHRADVDTTLTSAGQLLGTPAFMSPEQASGSANVVDGRTDVYSTGVVLYQMLTGALPFRESGAALLHEILQKDPRPLRQLNERIPRDLEAVCLKCLEKEPRARYANADDLADDLRRWLRGQPTIVRPMNRAKRLAKWTRRHPLAATALGIIFGLLGAVVFINEWRVHDLRLAAIEATHLRSAAESGLRVAESQGALVKQSSYNARIRLARELQRTGQISRLNSFLKDWSEAALEPFVQSFEWYFIGRIASTERAIVDGQRGAVFTAIGSPDGKVVIAGTEQGSLLFIDVATGQLLERVSAHTSCVNCLTFSPNGTLLASTSCDATIKLWDTGNHQHVDTLQASDSPVFACAFNLDGKVLATAHGNSHGKGPGQVLFWDVASRTQLEGGVQTAGAVEVLASSPNGESLAFASTNESLVLRSWDGSQVHSVEGSQIGRVTTLEFSPDGTLLATSEGPGDVMILRVPDLAPVRSLGVHHPHIQSLAFSAAGDSLVMGRYDGTVLLTPLTGASDAKSIQTVQGDLWSLEYLPAANPTMVTGGGDGKVRIWQPELLAEHRVVDAAAPRMRTFVVLKDGNTLAGIDDEHGERTWQLGRRPSHPHQVVPRSAASVGTSDSPDVLDCSTRGDWSPLAWHCGTAYRQDSSDGVWRLHDADALSRDGATLTHASVDGHDCHVRVRDTRTKSVFREWTIRGVPLGLFAISPSGIHAIFADSPGPIELWSLDTGCKLLTVAGPPREITAAAFAFDDSKFVIAGHGGASLVDLQSQRTLCSLAWEGGNTEAVCFSPDGRRIAIGDYGFNHAIHVFDVATGEELLALEGHHGHVRRVLFTPDSRDLVSVGWLNEGPVEILLWSGRKAD